MQGEGATAGFSPGPSHGNPAAVLELLARLRTTPVRRDGILDIPFEDYAEDVESPEVVELLAAHLRGEARPTLRAVLVDPRFQRWVTLSERLPIRKKLEQELTIVSAVIDEEHILDEEEAPAVHRLTTRSASPPRSEADLLREWAQEVGVTARLRDPAGVLVQRVGHGTVRRALRSARRLTVNDLLEGAFDTALARLTSAGRQQVATHAKAYVREAGERAIADRREAARIDALAYLPEGEGARAFLGALDAALARNARPTAGSFTLDGISLQRDPVRLSLRASLPALRAGRPHLVSLDLVLEDWREGALETKLKTSAKEGRTAEAARFVFTVVRRVLRDPKHALHAELVAYLDEAPWSRVLARLDALSERHQRAARQGAMRVEWQITAERGEVVVTPLVEAEWSSGRDAALRPTSPDALLGAGDQGHGLSARDEAVAHALRGAARMYSYGYPAGEARESTFRALTSLVGSVRVRGRTDARLRVASGSLTATVEEDAGSFRFVFDVGGERLEAQELRAGLDDAGYLIHVDPARGCVLLAHVGTRQAAVLAALASEAAVFPASSASALVEHAIGLGAVLPIALPTALAGEPIEADARPVVRMVRTGADAMSLSWLVRPIAGGPTFVPGEGPAQVLQHVGGRGAFAARSPEEERRRCEALRARLPAPIASAPLPEARCEGMETVLAIIEVLRAASEAGEAVVEWPRSLPRVIGEASWAALRLRVTAQRDWFGVNGTVAVGDVEVTLADLLAARRDGGRFVAVGPDKLVAIEEELRARLDALDSLTRSAKGGLALVRAAVPSLVELLASREQLDAAPAFWTLLARIDAARTSEPKVPRAFAKILRSYQTEGFRWMSRLAAWGAGACLADEMGLGKTVQALALLVSRSKEGPALVVAPTSVGPNWIHEAQRFAPSLKAILHRGAGRASSIAKLGPGDLVVTSYDVLARDAELLSGITFSTLVLDEAQAIKNGATTRAKAARALRADFRLALTGTPVENRLSELYSLMEFLNPGFFGSEADFRGRYVVPIERDKDASRSAALARVVQPFLLRRRKAEVATELPARTELTRAVERTPAERKLYEAARKLALAALSGADEDARFRVLAEIMRLRRLACHPRLDDATSKVPSSKLEAFVELVSELREGGHRALVFSQFTGHLALMEEALRDRSIAYLYLDGKTPVAERTRRVAAFQAGEGELFLISLKAGGTGLNLTAADTVIHLDPWWNPAVEDQATDRAHRIGQKRPVTVIRLIARGTIEEAVMALHDEKRQLAESILEGTAASGKLSIAELGALIREGAAEP